MTIIKEENSYNILGSWLILIGAIIFALVLIFISLADENYFSEKAVDNEKLGGELSSLRWASEGVEVGLEKEGGRIVLSLTSNFQDIGQAINAVKAIEESIRALIQHLKENGAPVRDDQFSLDFFEDDKLLKLNFEEDIADTILASTVLFLEQAADYCQAGIVSDIIDKIEDTEVYDVNITDSNCGILDIPKILNIVDLAEIYINITQIEDLRNLTLRKNTNALEALNMYYYFDYGGNCRFDISSEKDDIRVEVRDNIFVDFYPKPDWVGEEKINVKLICQTKELSDSFFIKVVDWSVDDLEVSNDTNVDSEGVVTNPGTDNYYETDTDKFKIINPIPDKSLISLSSDEDESFSISNNDYEKIEWYLNGDLINEDMNSYELNSLDEGKYVVKVKIINESLTDSKVWKVIVKDLEEPSFESGSSYMKKIILFLIVVFVFVIIGLIAWNFFKGRNKDINAVVNKELGEKYLNR